MGRLILTIGFVLLLAGLGSIVAWAVAFMLRTHLDRNATSDRRHGG